MSRDPRKPYGMGSRDRDRDRDRWLPSQYRRRSPSSRKRSRSRSPPMRRERDADSGRARSPRRNDKDVLDENILSEISKLPEPSELWEPTQNQDPNFGNAPAPPPPGFRPEPGNPNYQQNYQPSYSGIYDDFPPAQSSQQIPPEIASWNQMSLPPPPAPVFVNIEDQIKKEAAIESEMRHQKAALSKQREDYIKKASILKKELDTLKDQRNELRGDAKRSPSPDTKRFLKENTKLQLEIQNKLKTINNVVDMLNGIIGEEAQEVQDSDDSDRGSKRKSRSPSSGKKVNYVYYDPEMHWCRVCNEFPPTAKDYLNHLHSQAHHKMAAAHMEAPWHSVSGVNEGFPSYPSAPTKRTPIRGLQFFVPSTAWYCKLCDQFIGDLHCASAHLKSIQHSKNYTNFVEQNPHWETDWMSDRQKAFEKSRAGKKPEEKPQYAAHTITFHKDGFHTKRKDNSPPPPEKKRKKEKKKKNKRKQSSSSSSSSNSSSSDSEEEKKKKKKSKKKYEPDEKTLTEWMSAIKTERLTDNDRKILDNLKNRLKEKSEDKRRSPERKRQSEEREHSNSDRKTRERERESERRDRSRDRRDARESRDSRDSHARETRRSPSHADVKKPEIKKMPFIEKDGEPKKKKKKNRRGIKKKRTGKPRIKKEDMNKFVL